MLRALVSIAADAAAQLDSQEFSHVDLFSCEFSCSIIDLCAANEPAGHSRAGGNLDGLGRSPGFPPRAVAGAGSARE